MTAMLLGLLILLMVFLNIGGISSVGLHFGKGELLAGLGTLLTVGALDALGFWLLRELRGDA